MHALNTLNRLNAEAHARGIHTARCAGQFVVAKYEGATLVSYTAHDTAPPVASGLPPAADGSRTVVYAPLGAAHAAPAAGRDQSEDLAA